MIYSKCSKDKENCQGRILYPAKLSFRNEEETKTFPDKQKLRKCITTRFALQEMLKRVLQAVANQLIRMLISNMKTYESIKFTSKGFIYIYIYI